MAFKEHNYRGKKKEVTALLRKRLTLRDKVRYYKNKINSHLDKIKDIEDKQLPEVETKLDFYLDEKTSAQGI